jgi:hypothetical protein
MTYKKISDLTATSALASTDKIEIETSSASLYATMDQVKSFIYTEGTWTPTIYGSSTAGAHTYSWQYGTYERVGNLVTASFYIGFNSKDASMAGESLIGGLPFTSSSVLGKYGILSVGFLVGAIFATGYTVLSGYVAPSASNIAIRLHGSNLTSTALDASKCTTAFAAVGSITYRCV